MGNFTIVIKAVGGHGCQREVKSGGCVIGCGHRLCPDCSARAFVSELQRNGVRIESAELTHWPNTPEAVKDNLITGERAGSF